jgi:hypothetical protein
LSGPTERDGGALQAAKPAGELKPSSKNSVIAA